jgi:hypothetical protein
MAKPVPNEYEPAAAAATGGHVQMRITRQDGTRHVVLLDARDVPLARRHQWHVQTGGTKGRPRLFAADSHGVTLHRLVRGGPRGGGTSRVITFRNGDTLDCRRANLVYTTRRAVRLLAASAAAGRREAAGLADEGTGVRRSSPGR